MEPMGKVVDKSFDTHNLQYTSINLSLFMHILLVHQAWYLRQTGQ
jgi:hypothetical protein